MTGKKPVFVLFMAATVSILVALMGCSRGEEIEISLPQATSPQLSRQIYVGGADNNRIVERAPQCPGYFPA